MWRIAQKCVSRAGYHSVVIGADGRQLPLADRSIDTVVCTFPTPVIRESALWRELARVLRPEGQAIVVLAARTHSPTLQGLVELLSKRSPRNEHHMVRANRPAFVATGQQETMDQLLTVPHWTSELREVRCGDSDVSVLIATRA